MKPKFERGDVVNQMSAGEIKSMCHKNKFVLLRHYTGSVIGLNCKAVDIAHRRSPIDDKDLTVWVSFSPCDFNEYISYKTPFLNS